MQLSCFRSVSQSAKQLPSDWEEPAPEVATNNRRHTGSTLKVHCTHREHIEGAVCTQRVYRRCSAHTGRTQKVQCTHRECTESAVHTQSVHSAHGEGHTGGKSGTLERRHCDVWS